MRPLILMFTYSHPETMDDSMILYDDDPLQGPPGSCPQLLSPQWDSAHQPLQQQQQQLSCSSGEWTSLLWLQEPESPPALPPPAAVVPAAPPGSPTTLSPSMVMGGTPMASFVGPLPEHSPSYWQPLPCSSAPPAAPTPCMQQQQQQQQPGHQPSMMGSLYLGPAAAAVALAPDDALSGLSPDLTQLMQWSWLPTLQQQQQQQPPQHHQSTMSPFQLMTMSGGDGDVGLMMFPPAPPASAAPVAPQQLVQHQQRQQRQPSDPSFPVVAASTCSGPSSSSSSTCFDDRRSHFVNRRPRRRRRKQQLVEPTTTTTTTSNNSSPPVCSSVCSSIPESSIPRVTPSARRQLRDALASGLELTNVMSCHNMGYVFSDEDLRKLARRVRNVQFNSRGRTRCITMQLPRRNVQVQLFASGKCNVTGARTPKLARSAALLVTRVLARVGFPVQCLGWRIYNILATGCLGGKVDLNAMQQALPEAWSRKGSWLSCLKPLRQGDTEWPSTLRVSRPGTVQLQGTMDVGSLTRAWVHVRAMCQQYQVA